MKCLLGLYEKAMPNGLTIEEKLVSAKSAGYDFIELSIDESSEKLARLEWSKQERANLVQLMMKHQIYFRTMCLSGHRKYPLGSSEKNVRERALEIMEQAILLAFDLGIRVIQIAGYDVYYEKSSNDTIAMFGENLKHCVEIAAKYGVILAFETMETDFMNTVEKSMKYVKLINSPYLQVYPDIGNITNAALINGTDVLKDIESGWGHIVAAHIKETTPGIYREVPYGKGHVKFSACINELVKQGVRLYVTEFWYTGSESWEKDLVKNRVFAEQFF